MKHLFLSLLVCSSLTVAQTTLYGTSGSNFTPNGFTAEGGRWGVSLSGSPGSQDLYLSGRGLFLDRRLEVSVSNLYGLVEADTLGFRSQNTSVVPIVPSIKWQLDQDSAGRQTWGYSAGLSLPLGAYGTVGWKMRLPILSPELHVGLGFPIRSLHAFGGLALQVCDLDGQKLPVRLQLDGNFAASTGTLGHPEEGYLAAGVATSLGRNLTVLVSHRRDRHYDAPADRQNTQGTSWLRLLWTFDGIKTPPTRGTTR
jgi:hypothetical protein